MKAVNEMKVLKKTKIEPCKYCPGFHDKTCEYIADNLERLEGVKGDFRHAVNIKLACHDYYKSWTPGDVGLLDYYEGTRIDRIINHKVLFTGWRSEKGLRRGIFCFLNEDIAGSNVPIIVRFNGDEGKDMEYICIHPYKWVEKGTYYYFKCRIRKTIGRKELCPGGLREKGAVCAGNMCVEICADVHCWDSNCVHFNSETESNRKCTLESREECPGVPAQ